MISMYDNYGREIYNTLQAIQSFLEGWKADLDTWLTSFQEYLQGLFDLLFPFVFAIALFLGLFFIIRFFFPDWRV